MLPAIYFCVRSPGPRTSIATGGIELRQKFRRKRRADAIRLHVKSGRDCRLINPSFKYPDHVVKSNSSKPCRRFILPAGIRDNHDRMPMIEHRSRPRCVLAAEADVDAARKMCGGKFTGIASIEDLRAALLQCEHLVQRSWASRAPASDRASAALRCSSQRHK